jgi:catechol 2,3-dioxygenase-like lactoylglutathione lyase family enzyme
MAVPPISPLAVHHIAIQCNDLPAMVRFYEKVLRLKVERRWQTEQGLERSVWLRTGTTVVALERCEGQPEWPPWQTETPGLHLLALQIPWENRDIWRAWLAYYEVPVLFETQWTMYVHDPEGTRIGLSHFPYSTEGVKLA